MGKKKAKQQMIVLFDAPDVAGVKRLIETCSETGVQYMSPGDRLPIVFSVKISATDIRNALFEARADYIMVDIGLTTENIYSAGTVSTELFGLKLQDKAVKSGKKNRRMVPPVADVNVALKASLDEEDYIRAAICRDILNGDKTVEDLQKYDTEILDAQEHSYTK